jgi:integrase
MALLTPAQINAFVNAIENPKYRTLYMLAIMSGARQGELLGLKWGDVDWANSQIHIQRTFNNRRFFLPKTKASNRKIDLGPNVMTALKRWKLMCPSNDLNLVFPSNTGTPLNRCNVVNRHFYPALKKASLAKIRFHDLRHTYASLLIDQGENIKYIQNQLGHSTPTMTLDVYAHLMKPANQESACRLENTIFGANGDQMETMAVNVCQDCSANTLQSLGNLPQC